MTANARHKQNIGQKFNGNSDVKVIILPVSGVPVSGDMADSGDNADTVRSRGTASHVRALHNTCDDGVGNCVIPIATETAGGTCHQPC